MEDEYDYTALAGDTVAFESPIAESRLMNFDINTEVLDVGESVKDSSDQMEDYCEKEIVLDSDDEGREQNEARNLVKGNYSPVTGRFLSGRDGIGMLKRQQVSIGHFRRLDNKFGEHVFLHHNSAREDTCYEESNAGRTYNENRFQEQPVIVDNEVSMSSPDQRPISTNAKECHVDPKYVSMVRDILVENPLDEKKLSLPEPKSIEMGKNENYHCEQTELNYVESPVHAESHMKALEFVDHYLSVSDLGSYKDVECRKSIRTKSPPSLRAKGFQILARRVNLGCTVSKSITFGWDEEQIEKDQSTSPIMNKNSIFGYECDKSGNLSVNQESDNINSPKEISRFQSKEKLPQNSLCTKHLDTDSLNSNDMDKVGSNSGFFIAYDSMELDEQFDAGLQRQNAEEGEQLRLSPDALDIGLATQIAAEAMEALVHAAPPLFDVCATHQRSDNILDSSNTLNNKSKSKYVANGEEAFVGWGCRRKRSKCVNMSTVQNKNMSFSAAKCLKNWRGAVTQLSVSKNLTSEKLMTRKNLGSRNPEHKRISKCGGATEINVQLEECGFNERDSLKEFRKVDFIYGRSSKQPIEGIKSDSHSKRRKMISGHYDVRQIGVEDTCLKLNSDSSSKMKAADTAKREENSDLHVASKTRLKLNLWNYPKGKRSRQCARHHSVRSSKQSSPRTAVENNMEKHHIVNEEAHSGVAKLLVYTRRHKFSLEGEQIGSSLKSAGDFSSPSVNDSANSDRKFEISIEFDRAKPSIQCCKLDDGKSPAVDSSDNMKSGIFSNGHSMTLQVFEGSDKSKQPFNLLSRSPLMKELMRLGYTKSLPDFLPKDSRRRRATEKVCILFSQNLETSILKQQRKIVARLGFSIASCCSDATHFVTDRFMRTRNMLEAIALGKPVVTHLWLEGCEQAGYVIDEKSYILRDEKKEKEIGFNLLVSLTRASQHPLLEGSSVVVTPNVKPGIEVINSLVKAVHGQAVPSIMSTKDKVIPDDLLVLSCEEDYAICLPFLEKGAPIYDSELLLNGIVTQKLEYERYQIFKDFLKNSICHSTL